MLKDFLVSKVIKSILVGLCNAKKVRKFFILTPCLSLTLSLLNLFFDNFLLMINNKIRVILSIEVSSAAIILKL